MGLFDAINMFRKGRTRHIVESAHIRKCLSCCDDQLVDSTLITFVSGWKILSQLRAVRERKKGKAVCMPSGNLKVGTFILQPLMLVEI